jgi:hypothetical protein
LLSFCQSGIHFRIKGRSGTRWTAELYFAMNMLPFFIILQRRHHDRNGWPAAEDTAFDRKMRTWLVVLFCLIIVAAVVAQGLGFVR